MIITIENYTKSYGEKTLFSGVNLSMDPGDKIGIVGVNGTGKSTFLKAVAGLIPVDDGTVVTMRGLRIEYLAQDKEFEPENTVLMELGTEHKAVGSCSLDPAKPNPFVPRLIQGIWRKHFGQAETPAT